MECKCDGELKRIAIDAYECSICGKKQAIACLSLPAENIGIDLAKGPDTTVNLIINIGAAGHIGIYNSKLMEELKNQIDTTYQASGKLFKK